MHHDPPVAILSREHNFELTSSELSTLSLNLCDRNLFELCT